MLFVGSVVDPLLMLLHGKGQEWKIGNKDGRWVGGIGGWLEGWTLGWENERLVRRMADWMDEWKIEQKDWRFFRRMRDWLGGLEIG